MKRAAFLAVTLFLSFSCAAQARTASASLEGTGLSPFTSGSVSFKEENGGLRVKAEVKSVTPGKHGFHIHENGSCEGDGKAAGNHFNPDEVGHGHLVQHGFGAAHAGDLGNIEVGGDGTGKLEVFLPGLNLSEGRYNVKGRSVILHEKEDDYSQPAGNAGGRIACGVIR